MPGAQQLSFTSSTTLHRPHSLRVRLAQFDELYYSAQAMQPKSQIDSGYSAHKASAPGAQHLSLTSSTTLHRSCSLRVDSAQDIQPMRPQRQEPNSSVWRAQLLNSNHTARNRSTQMLNSGYAAKKSIQIKQNSTKSTSRGEKSKIKNEYSLRKRLRMSWVLSPAKKINK